MPPCRSRTSSSPRHRATWAVRSPHLPLMRRWAAGMAKPPSSGQLAQVYGFTDLDGSQPDCWRYLLEVQAGKPADATGHR